MNLKELSKITDSAPQVRSLNKGINSKRYQKLPPKGKFKFIMDSFKKGDLVSRDNNPITVKKQAVSLAFKESGLNRTTDSIRMGSTLTYYVTRVHDSEQVKDNLEGDGTCTVWHRTKTLNLADILMTGGFSAGKGAGSMYGKGFYANLEKDQVMTSFSKGAYGNYVLECSLVNLKDFFVFDWSVFENTELCKTLGATEDDFCFKQAEYFGIPTGSGITGLQQRCDSSRSSHAAARFYDNSIASKSKIRVRGLVYHGNHDGKALVCYYPSRYVVPKRITGDDGKTWTEIDSDSFLQKITSGTYLKSGGKDVKGLKGDERSEVRAENLFETIENMQEDKQWAHIAAHLLRIKDPSKLYSRKKLMAKTFPGMEKLILGFDGDKYREITADTQPQYRQDRWERYLQTNK